jgi:transposase
MSRVLVGVDLGGKFHEAQVTTESGERLGRSFRVGRGQQALVDLAAGVEAVAGSEAEPVYTIEATQDFWLELVHPLMRQGHRVHLVSPSKSSGLRAFYRRHTKTDAIDAESLARLPLVDPDLRVAWVSDPRVDAMRRLARQAWQLRERMSARKRRIISRVLVVYPGFESVFTNRYCGAARLFYGRYLDPAKARRLGRQRLGMLLRKRAWGKFDDAKADRLWAVVQNAPVLDVSYEDLQLIVNQDLALLEAQERSQEALRERLAELYSEVDPEQRLLTIPGLGEFLAATITAFIGEAERGRTSDQVVAHSGLCPRKKSSAGSDTPNQPLTKHGDPTMRSCLYVAAEVARHYDPELQAFYLRLTKRGKHHKVAICALASKILRRCVAILREDRPYEVEHATYLIRKQTNEGKKVRESVSEVAKLLNDSGEPTSLHEAYAHKRLAARPRAGRRKRG